MTRWLPLPPSPWTTKFVPNKFFMGCMVPQGARSNWFHMTASLPWWVMQKWTLTGSHNLMFMPSWCAPASLTSGGNADICSTIQYYCGTFKVRTFYLLHITAQPSSIIKVENIPTLLNFQYYRNNRLRRPVTLKSNASNFLDKVGKM